MIERGTIVRVVGRQVYVEVPRLGLGVQFGPCDLALDPATALAAGDLPQSLRGRRCVVSPVHGVPDDLVVLGIIG
jgi:hypothetical protein